MPLPKEIPQNTVQNGGALGSSPDIGGVERPIQPEEVPYFDGSNAPVYQGGSNQQGAPASQNQEDIDRAVREAMGMN